jgi:putative transposase
MTFARKNIRLPAENYVGRRRFFITLCCTRRRKFLAQSPFAARIIEILRATAVHHKVAVYTYCLMPDHLHALVIGLEPSSNLQIFVMDFKRKATAGFRRSSSGPLWQKKFYDYILRSNDSNDRVAAYIWMNPVRKGLCVNPQDYPFSGSFGSAWKPSLDPTDPWIPSWKQNASRLTDRRVL